MGALRCPILLWSVRALGGAVSGTLGLLEEGESRRLTLDAETRNLAFGGQATDRLLAGRHVVQARAQVTPDAVLLERLSIDGPALFARVAGQLRDGRPDLTLEARLADMDYVAPGITGALSLGGTARDTGRAYALDLSANGPAGLSARVNGSVTKALQANLAISGTTDVALINPRIEPRSVRGPAQFDIALQGPLALSSASGTATLDGVSVVDPRNGVRLSDVQARADLTGGQAQIDLTGQSAQGGRLALGGSINLAPPLDSSLRARLDALRIIDPQLFEATVSGDLEITGPLARGPDLGGRLRLDSMELRIPRVGLTGPAYVPPGIEHLGESGAAQTTRARAGIFQGETNGRQRNPSRLDLSIDAPNRIFIRGRGLDAELGGTLRLTGTTADLIPIGQFNLIRGRLDLLGNRFALNEGFASLQGDFMPFVRLIASTEREGRQCPRGVARPRPTRQSCYSNPAPNCRKRKSFRFCCSGAGLKRSACFRPRSLHLRWPRCRASPRAYWKSWRRNVGLDDLDVRTNEEGEATVRVGRYLTENVYTDLEVNPQGDSEASINIDLSPSLTARGQVDNAGRSSVGVFFERDY